MRFASYSRLSHSGISSSLQAQLQSRNLHKSTKYGRTEYRDDITKCLLFNSYTLGNAAARSISMYPVSLSKC